MLTSPPPLTTPRENRKKKVLAVIAAGSVLGLGAVAVLAAWTDTETAKATFGTGAFQVEGAVWDGTAWQDVPSGQEGVLNFGADVNTADVTPGDVLGAKYRVRLSDASTEAATLDIAAADLSKLTTLDGFIKTKTVELATENATCDSTLDFDTVIDATGTPATIQPKFTDPATPADEKYYCMLVQVQTENGTGVPLPQAALPTANPVTWTIKSESIPATVPVPPAPPAPEPEPAP